MKQKSDVIIAGGGLAGLGLAHQISESAPDLSITLLEKETFPRPKAIAKVGESTVEIGSRYLAKHLALEDHLKKDHLKKFGIRMFFGEHTEDFSGRDELGASQSFGIPTYQVDRGDLENTLHDRLKSKGVNFVEAADIRCIDLGNNAQQVMLSTEKGEHALTSKWLVDCAGRASLLKKNLNLSKKNDHKANAIWFRVDKRIEIDSWSNDVPWTLKCQPQGHRWLSTNHLVGPGYWVWIIPLASGVTSIGIVMDDEAFSQANIVDRESAERWLLLNQRKLADEIESAKFLDFVVLNDYSYDCKKLFSDQGWAIAGEAGVFADPFYSPGSDFIGIGNSFIAQLVSDECAGRDIRFKSALYERLFKSIYENTLSLYVGQYGGFGDRKMMGLKLLWDYSYYWGVLSLLFFRNALFDIDLLRVLSPTLMQAQQLNQVVQAQFRARASKRIVLPAKGLFMDQYQIPCLQEFNKVLLRDDEMTSVKNDLGASLDILKGLSTYITDMLSESPTLTISDEEFALLGDYRKKMLA